MDHEEEQVPEEVTMESLLAKWGAHRDFIWRPWLAEGVLHVVGAEQGGGKTTFIAALIKIIAMGKPLPNGTEPGITGKVFIGETENRLDRLVRVLTQWGVPNEMVDLPETPTGSIDLMRHKSAGWSEVEKALKNPGVCAAFLDTLTGALGNRENDSAVKEVVYRLGRLARENGKTIISTHHLSQLPLGMPPRTTVIPRDFRGHGGIIDSPPILIGLVKPNPNKETRVMIEVKNGETSWTESPTPFLVDMKTGEMSIEIEYPERETKPTAGERCAEDLRRMLENSAQPAKDVKKALLGEDHTGYAIQRAKEILGIVSFQDGLNRKGKSSHKWRLPRNSA